MTKTGPQKYPGASLRYFYQDRYPGDAMESNVGVIHTTEGTSLPSYDGGASAPNLTAVPNMGAKRLDWFQHFDFDVSARALVNKPGGVQTNTGNAVQVELVGTCDRARRVSWGSKRAGVDYLYWPDAPDWALAGLADFVRWSRDNHYVAARSTVEWIPYPSSRDVRLTGAQWDAYYGWLGHQHVPENDHGDPGDLDFARVLEFVTDPQGPDMPKPDRQMLYRAEDTQLVPNVPYTIYWTVEGQDDGQGHGGGGKTMATNVCYSTVLTLAFEGLADNGIVEVLPVEEDATGVQTGEGKRHMVRGRPNAMYLSESIPLIGIVTNRYAVQVVNRSANVVTMSDAQAASWYWPNA